MITGSIYKKYKVRVMKLISSDAGQFIRSKVGLFALVGDSPGGCNKTNRASIT